MKRESEFLWRIADAADLSGEPLPYIPLVELLGDKRVLVENHKGITTYSCSKISVAVSFGQIGITGNNLRIIKMTASQLIVSGKIDRVELCRKG